MSYGRSGDLGGNMVGNLKDLKLYGRAEQGFRTTGMMMVMSVIFLKLRER